MSTAFRAIAMAIAASLSAAPALAGVPVFQNRLKPLPEDRMTAVVVRKEGSNGQEAVLGMVDWQTDYAIECYGRGAPGTDPDAAADDLLQAVWARMAVIDLSTYQVMGVTLNPGINWDYGEAETPFACAIFRLQIIHRTASSALV